MKKNIRKILVNGKNYIWNISRNNCDGDGSNLISIWHNKEKIYCELCRGDIQVTPSLIKSLIESQ